MNRKKSFQFKMDQSWVNISVDQGDWMLFSGWPYNVNPQKNQENGIHQHLFGRWPSLQVTCPLEACYCAQLPSLFSSSYRPTWSFKHTLFPINKSHFIDLFWYATRLIGWNLDLSKRSSSILADHLHFVDHVGLVKVVSVLQTIK